MYKFNVQAAQTPEKPYLCAISDSINKMNYRIATDQLRSFMKCSTFVFCFTCSCCVGDWALLEFSFFFALFNHHHQYLSALNSPTMQ